MNKLRHIILLMCLGILHLSVSAQSVVNTKEIQFSPDGNYVVAIGNIAYPYFRIWDLTTDLVIVDDFPVAAHNNVDVDKSGGSLQTGFTKIWSVQVKKDEPPKPILPKHGLPRQGQSGKRQYREPFAQRAALQVQEL